MNMCETHHWFHTIKYYPHMICLHLLPTDHLSISKHHAHAKSYFWSPWLVYVCNVCSWISWRLLVQVSSDRSFGYTDQHFCADTKKKTGFSVQTVRSCEVLWCVRLLWCFDLRPVNHAAPVPNLLSKLSRSVCDQKRFERSADAAATCVSICFKSGSCNMANVAACGCAMIRNQRIQKDPKRSEWKKLLLNLLNIKKWHQKRFALRTLLKPTTIVRFRGFKMFNAHLCWLPVMRFSWSAGIRFSHFSGQPYEPDINHV